MALDISKTSSTPSETPQNSPTTTQHTELMSLMRILDSCRKCQRMISASAIAKTTLMGALVFCAITCGISGLAYCNASNPDSIALASTIFFCAMVLQLVLWIGFILCPVPNPYGTSLVATANMIPETTQALKILKARLIHVGEQAIEWKVN